MIRRSLLSVFVILLALNVAAWAGDDLKTTSKSIHYFPNPAQFEIGSRDWMRASGALKYRPLVSQSLIDNCPHSYDVLHYDITLEIDFDNELIYGDTQITSVSQAPDLDSIDLDLTVLTVDAVLSGTDSLVYVHNDPVLSVELGQTYAVGDTFEVRVIYHGQPGNEGPTGFGGFYFAGVPIHAFQMGVGLEAEPASMGKYWFPCWDWPCDKATAEYHITVPGTGKKVICNGSLVEAVVDTLNDTATWVWAEDHQIAPHCMTVNAGRFSEIVDSTYSWIYYWVFARNAEDALIHFQNVDLMMDAFIDRFGPYPFSKFSYVEESKGDMEHQTCVTHIGSVINPNHTYDWLLAHEMGHQWWGDCVSVHDWRDVWLSEGFATYSEAVFEEHAYGTQAYKDYIQASIMTPVFNSGENFPIYDPNYLWGTTTYEKGACVLHMLRHVVGDSVFWDALAAYRAAYEHQSATTPEFQAEVETVSGQDLDWFFDEWIYDVGWPEYEYSWLAEDLGGGTYNLNLVIDQVQTNGPVYTMPVDIKVTTTGGDTVLTPLIDQAHVELNYGFDAAPTAVELDPDNWILDTATEVPHAGVSLTPETCELRLEPSAPNPFGPATTLRYSVPAAQYVRLDIYNALGQKVVNLVDQTVPAGWGVATWDGRDASGRRVAAGTYFCRMVTGDGSQVRAMVLLR